MSRNSANNNNANRRTYNRVSSAPEGHHDEDDDTGNDSDTNTLVDIELAQQQSNTNNNNTTRTTSRRANRLVGRRRGYGRVATVGDEDNEDHRASDEARSTTSLSRQSSSSSSKRTTMTGETDDASSLPAQEDEEDDDGTRIAVTILDFAQTKFTVRVNPSSTVARFKQIGSTVHKVPVVLQRLIYHGKLLQDDKTLKECGIEQDGVIVHLFPKPRVVIADDAASATTSNADDASANETGGTGRVPTIVLDPEEAERRSQILVLGSVEYIEAQNNVKLFSFMLLIISSIELLNLLAVALGVPQQEAAANANSHNSNFPPIDYTDDVFDHNDDGAIDPFAPSGNSSSSVTPSSNWDENNALQPNFLYQSWGWANNVDLLLSLAGVYVAIMGIQASNENTLKLARVYLVGTFMVGVGWMLFNYFITVKIDLIVEEEHREKHPDDDFVPDMSDEDVYKSALSVMLLPGLVWLMCCARASQFYNLLYEAETEAQGRIQEELERSGGGSALPMGHAEDGVRREPEELALQNNAAVIA